jgi:hypothetical protein
MIETSVRDQALSHCEECPSCARNLEQQQSLSVALRNWARASESIEAVNTIQERLIAALRDKQVQRRPMVKYNWKYAAAAVAAVLLVSFAVFAFRMMQGPGQDLTAITSKPADSEKTGSQVSASANPGGNTVAKASTAKRSNSVRRFQPPRRVTNSVAQTSKAATSPNTSGTGDYATEIATEFLPLGYGNALNLQDGGQIVRVEVPRSTLASFGLPVNMNRVSERVKADVLFGADGAARAIRFVQ